MNKTAREDALAFIAALVEAPLTPDVLRKDAVAVKVILTAETAPLTAVNDALVVCVNLSNDERLVMSMKQLS